ncbi:periplasmic trypsin-like serine protease lipoprotein DegQ [Citrifermentans bemidjiense Bem]|uniref:Probable periplasmic serine endoprotease DegP-like n=1 Tax=Citrifermentans bemidjiense (strain ATCC BAA-1014 / DSM 16622 / JCM 12645 / Bem) TaxID=404380 RepID=B5EB97_CITBB|nr:DegQ family serine endoprotease [Citrifermentans bemidjiense]ACH40389.1 periplasmic trypsin-like serine protease lipoprotein DegQ [Citrifermentans bemidjiense Bem]
MKSIRLLAVCLIVCTLMIACKKKEQASFYESERKESVPAPVQEVPKDILVTQQAFTTLVKTVTPSVVNISTIGKKKLVRPFFESSPFFDEFFGENARPQYRREHSLGSGFILNKEGYIVTNDHVVRDAETIQVKLSNESVYKGKVIGSDPKTDIAVIKIDAKEPLPAAVLGDSNKLQVGQWAVAIGNPFGLDRTVTVGVVSATGRSNMGIETYEDFIQTDASINPGNSGGPLLNIYGEVIGINTAIVAAGQGIGFAIPVNMAKQVVTQLISKGNVSRGWLGVSIQSVTEEMANSFGLPKAYGALVNDVVPGGPAAKAGVMQGDVITSFAGTAVKDVRQLQRLVGETPIGKKVPVELYRDGKKINVQITTAPADSAQAQTQRPAEREAGALGLSVEELGAEMRSRGVTGVVVSDLEPGGIAEESGIQRGDIIVSVNQKKVRNLAEYQKAMADAGKRGAVALLVRRGSASIYFALKLR